MREISSREYAEEVSDRIEDALDDALIRVYNELADDYGFRNIDEMCVFDLYFYGDANYAGQMRDIAIELFEECGMDIRPDGKEW